MPVKIPETYYCGRKEDGLAFITPDGTDSAAQKRKETVNNWTQGYHYVKKSDISLDDPKHFFTFNNTPTEGFLLKKAVSRYCTDNKMFRIEDPRGFQIEITAYNLADVCLEGGIHHGVLQGSYVYGRDGSNNVLIAVGCPRFKEAFEFTKAVGTKEKPKCLSLRELKIGQKVSLLSQGQLHTALYVGRRSQYETGWRQQEYLYHDDGHPNTAKNPHYRGSGWSDYNKAPYVRHTVTDELEKPKHTFVCLDENGNIDASRYGVLINPVSPNVVEILDSDFKTEEETCAMFDEWAGPIVQPAEICEWLKRYGYVTEPDRARAWFLDRAEAEAFFEQRKHYLETFGAQMVEPQP